MSKTKKAIISGVVLIVLGAIISIVALISVEFDFNRLYPTAEYDSLIIKESFKNISIESDQSNIIIKPSEDDSCKITYDQRTNISETVQNDTLIIKNTCSRKWYDYIGFVCSAQLTIYISQHDYDLLAANSQSGDIHVSSGITLKEIQLNSASGNINCASSALSHIDITTESGDIHANNIDTDNISVRSTSGNIKLSSVDCIQDIKIDTASGDISGTDFTCANLSAASVSGKIDFLNLTASNNINIQSTSGDILLKDSDAYELQLKTASGNISGSLLSDKIFNANSSSGDIKLPPSVQGGSCIINTSSGDINITLAK